jgi:hypothetical protein
MKSIFGWFGLILLLGSFRCDAAEGGAASEFEFVGYANLAGSQIFAVKPVSAAKGTWLKLGEVLNGFALKSYDEKTETLTLSRGGESIPLRLVDAHIREKAADPAPKRAKLSDMVDKELTEELKGWPLRGRSKITVDGRTEERDVEFKIAEETWTEMGAGWRLKTLPKIDKHGNIQYRFEAVRAAQAEGEKPSTFSMVVIQDPAGGFGFEKRGEDGFKFEFTAAKPDGKAPEPPAK